jgi:hypothetical protein
LRATDIDQLCFAAAEGRTLVSHNYGDFEPMTEELRSRGEPHAGVLLVPESFRQNDYGGIARALARYAAEHPDGLPPYMIDYLSTGRS